MNKEESSLTNSRDSLAKLADLYAEKPLVRALFTLATGVVGSFPGASALTDTIRELIASGVDDIQRERLRELFDELATGEKYLTAELIKQNDFIHAFICTYRAAMRTRHKKKIRMFARLLLTGVRENRLDGEELEEFISILDELSVREYEILLTLERLEHLYPYRKNKDGELENDLQRTYQYWDTFLTEVENKFGLTRGVIIAMLSRLTRTGLYRPVSGTYIGDPGDRGYTTELFNHFLSWLEATTK